MLDQLIECVRYVELLKQGLKEYSTWGDNSAVVATLEKEIASLERDICNMKLNIQDDNSIQ